MSHPERPPFLTQDPNNGGSCFHNGRQFGWVNCTPTSTAMLIRRSTLNEQKVSGCDVRILTGDWQGGTMLSQCGEVARDEYGVDVSVHVGSNFMDPPDLKDRLQAGRSAVVQGNAGALINTKHQSTGNPVNHAVFLNEMSGDGRVLVYDPARSNRHASFGKVTEGPEWWSWDLLLAFMAALRPWGDGDPRKLGRGRAYAMIGPDTEPHAHLRFRAHETNPLPRTFIVKSPIPGERINVRKGPSNKYDIVKTKVNGSEFVAWQRTNDGQSLAGSKTWWGNHSGTRWVHDSGVKEK